MLRAGQRLIVISTRFFIQAACLTGSRLPALDFAEAAVQRASLNNVRLPK